LTIKVSNKPEMSRDEIRAFLNASVAVHFAGEKKEDVYAWVSGGLGEQHWAELGLQTQKPSYEKENQKHQPGAPVQPPVGRP
jgi:hypothetical protein